MIQGRAPIAGARRARLGHHLPQASGSAQFGGILRERLPLPVSEESADECDVRSSLRQKILINNECPCHINIVDRNDHSHSMRPQRIHHRDHDGDYDSNSAIDADVDDDNADGSKQQRKQM